MEGNPLQFLEGVPLPPTPSEPMLPTFYLRGEFWPVAANLDRRLPGGAGWLVGEKLFGTDYSLHIYTHLGAGAYNCGEEDRPARIIEGNAANRVSVHLPAVYGLYGKPTVVNNVETLTNLPLIIERVRMVQIPGYGLTAPGQDLLPFRHVKKPGNYELPFGTTYATLSTSMAAA